MKRGIFLCFGLVGIVGLMNGVYYSSTLAEEGNQARVNFPVTRLTNEMENRVTNMIEGVLEWKGDIHV